MDFLESNFIAIAEIAWVNILLSGDNAVVIAMASRSLPAQQRKWGIILGAGVAVALRILFAICITWIMQVSYLKIIGGALLFWIALKLLQDDGDDEHKIAAHDQLWRAVGTIALADMTMSLDNVIAIAAIAHGNTWLFVFGLALSVPLVVVGSGFVLMLIERFPLFVWAGAALLGWIAGGMIATDPAAIAHIGEGTAEEAEIGLAAVGALLVIVIGYWQRRRAARQNEEA
jgi:YjbE family integral membrane protein